MKVLHVVTAFPRYDGDVITPWLGQLLLGLQEAGADVSVLAPAYRGGGATEWRGIPVRRFRYAPARLETLTHDQTAPDRLRERPWMASLLPGYALGGLWAAVRAAGNRPDVIHVHWAVPHGLFGAATQAASGGSAAIVSSYYSVELNWIERRLPVLVPFLRWTIESADVVTAISTSTANRVQRYAERPVSVIPFAAGLSTDDEATKAVDQADRAGQAPTFLFVGRLVERKGVEVLLRAIRRLEDGSVLEIVGEGAHRARLEALARSLGVSDRVRFLGRVDERELRAAYARADVFVLPAVVDAKGDTEGLGVVLLEALLAGVPVVASDVGGIPDIVTDGDTGWLVPSGDSASLATALSAVVADPTEASRRVERGRARIAERFTQERVVTDLLEAYREAMAARPGRNG